MSLSSDLERLAGPDQLAKLMIVVEDEPVVSILIEMYAAELGWQVVGTAMTEPAALELLTRVRPTVAVIDIHLGPAISWAVPTACQARGIAVLFVTGYTAFDLPKEYGNAPVLAKPCSVEEFEQALSRCARPHPSRKVE